MTYKEFLQSDKWKETSLRLKKEAHWECEECGTKTQHLHCHHKTYKYGWLPPDDWLMVVCDECHNELHGFDNSLAELAKRVKDLN